MLDTEVDFDWSGLLFTPLVEVEEVVLNVLRTLASDFFRSKRTF